MVSSTCSPSSPDARGRPPPRRARAMSSTPSPRPSAAPEVGRTCHSSAPVARSLISPSNRFGSGSARVASVPVISTKLPRQRRLEAEHERGHRALRVLDQSGDVGGDLDGEYRAGPRPTADDPGVAAAAARGRDLLGRAEDRGQHGQVVRPDVEQRSRAALEQELRIGMPALRARVLHQRQRRLRHADHPFVHQPPRGLQPGAEHGVGCAAEPQASPVRLGEQALRRWRCRGRAASRSRRSCPQPARPR